MLFLGFFCKFVSFEELNLKLFFWRNDFCSSRFFNGLRHPSGRRLVFEATICLDDDFTVFFAVFAAIVYHLFAADIASRQRGQRPFSSKLPRILQQRTHLSPSALLA